MVNEEKYFEEIASYKLLAKKEVGQNFLIDSNAAKRIVDALNIQSGENVLEIGCGAGSLSFFLGQFEGDCTLIDIDEAMLAKVTKDFEGVENVHPVYGNAVKWDYSSYEKIVGNLPYYITSLIIEKVLLGSSKAKKAVFMVQKEAAERLLAPVKTKDYSPLGVYIATVSKARRLFNVQRSCFAPAPHVDSSVIELVFDEEKHNEKAAKMYRLCCSLFLQRRKTIYNNLKNYLHDGEKASRILAEVNIPQNLRPEEITPEQYWILAQHC